jgi:hypothetical protein
MVMRSTIARKRGAGEAFVGILIAFRQFPDTLDEHCLGEPGGADGKGPFVSS